MAKKSEEEFKYISEEDYKTLISIYQQKVFEIFNRNISLEAKVLTLNTLVESLNETIVEITKEKATRSVNKRTKNTPKIVESVIEYEETDDDEKEVK
jgi:hypothetical protein